MVQYYYKRDAVPVGEEIRLEVQFRDSAGNKKDADAYPTVLITDADGTVAQAATTSGVRRVAVGKYALEYTVPDGYASGVWYDTWTAELDGSPLTAEFDFAVDPSGTIEAAGGTVLTPEMEVGDDPYIEWTQGEIKGINILMSMLRYRLKNTQVKPDGVRCDIFSVSEMESFLIMALSEFNAQPAITTYSFADHATYTMWADILTEGAYLKALAMIVPPSAGQEFVINDNGVSITPASVSSAINGVMSALYSEYRAKLRAIKAHHRATPLGMGAGSILVTNPAYRRLRARKENQII